MDPRLEQLVSALVARRIEDSLHVVQEALAAWGRGEKELYEVHAAVLRHGARTSALSARVARAGIEGPLQLLRDALEAGLLEREEFVKLARRDPEEVPPPPPLDEEAIGQTAPPMPPKRSVMETLLEAGAVLVHVDSRREGVQVPVEHAGQAKLVLRFGHALTPPIPDLAVDDDGVRGTLTFRGRPFLCQLPWGAIYALVGDDGRGLIWPEDVPAEVRDELGRAGGKDQVDRTPPPRAPKPPGRGHLKLV
jgi:stringent starvation protein B